MAINGILFDKDATIVDFTATFEPATDHVLRDLCKGDPARLSELAGTVGFDLDSGKISADSIIIAGSGEDIAQSMAAVLGREDVQEFRREVDQKFGEVCLSLVVELPGAVDSLKKLMNSGFQLGIATNDAVDNAISQMRKLGAFDLFAHIFGADSGFGSKPGPGMVQAFLAKTELTPSSVMMVGDSTHDLEAGKAANVITCAVLTGPADPEALSPLADYVLSSIVELPELLGDLNSM